MTIILPQCLDCIHLDRNNKPPVCAAFPEGIPDAILMNKVDHREPVKGDHGIQFVALPNRESIFS